MYACTVVTNTLIVSLCQDGELFDTYHFSVMVQLKVLHRVSVDAPTKVKLVHSVVWVPVRRLGLEHKPIVIARGWRKRDCHVSRFMPKVVGFYSN